MQTYLEFRREDEFEIDMATFIARELAKEVKPENAMSQIIQRDQRIISIEKH